MIRLLIFLLIILALAYGFSWLADRPGEISLVWQGDTYEVDLIVFMAGLVALVAAIMFIWAVIRTILRSPAIMSRFFRARRRDRGYQSLTTGLIAAGSGDSVAARRHAKESGKLLGKEPLVKLLDAQTSLLEGRREEAREVFADMLKDDQTKLVALRGLYLEAEREGADEAARQYAAEANTLAPSLPWAGNAKLRYQSRSGDWEEALRTLESNRSAGLIDKEAATRQKAVLLTAQAFSEEQAEPKHASKLAQQAHKYAPDLVPAAVVGARAYARFDKTRAASRLIESVWKKTPHPDLAEAYVHLRAGDSVLDRFKRAKHLASLKAHHPEGNIAIAEAAIAARDWSAARSAMEPVLRLNLTERACLIMADIEEGEHGDRGRMRDWLSRAVRAPRDAAWTADGYVSETWMPISPVTGEIDAFEWKVPVEQLKGPEADANTVDIDDLVKPLQAETSKDAFDDSSAEEPKTAKDRGSAARAGTVAAAAATASTMPAGSKSDAVVLDRDAVDIEVTEENTGDLEKANVPNAVEDRPGVASETAPVTKLETEKPASSSDAAGKETAADETGSVSPGVGDEKTGQSDEQADLKPDEKQSETVADDPKSKSSADVSEPGAPHGDDAERQATDKKPASEADEPEAEKLAANKDDADSAKSSEKGDTSSDDDVAAFPFGRRPDDPGIDPNEPEEAAPKRFRLF